jgi:PAS domain S-box-containing protein
MQQSGTPMNWLDDLLQTLAICRRALGPGVAHIHEERLRWIEHLLRAVVPDHGGAQEQSRRGGDPAKRAHQMLCRLVMEHTTDLISVFDDEGHYLYASPSHIPVLGYGQQFLIGTSTFRLVHPDDLLLVNAHWRQLLEHGQAQATLRFRHASGTYRWLDIHGTVARWGGGKQIVTVARDTTARREAEAEARASEERFRLMVEGVKDYAICMLDPLGRVISWNSGAEQILGYTEAEIVGRHIACFYPSEQVACSIADDVLHTAATNGESITEGVHVRKDGRRIEVRDVVTSLYDNGVLRGFAKITRDMGERKRVESELRETAAQHRSLLAAIPDAVYCVQRDGIVREQLAEGEAPLHCDSTPIAGKHVCDVFPQIADVLLPLIAQTTTPDTYGSTPPMVTWANERNRRYEWRVVPFEADHVLLLCRATTTTR